MQFWPCPEWMNVTATALGGIPRELINDRSWLQLQFLISVELMIESIWNNFVANGMLCQGMTFKQGVSMVGFELPCPNLCQEFFSLFPKGPDSWKMFSLEHLVFHRLLAWNFHSRLKTSFALENTLSTLRIPPNKAPWCVRVKVFIPPLQFPISKGNLEFVHSTSSRLRKAHSEVMRGSQSQKLKCKFSSLYFVTEFRCFPD